MSWLLKAIRYVYLVNTNLKTHLDSLYSERAVNFWLSVVSSPQVYIPSGQIPVTKLACALCVLAANRKIITRARDEFEFCSAVRRGAPYTPYHESQCATFSFKHHSTGEAWPACRAILPLHSNTTCDRRGLRTGT